MDAPGLYLIAPDDPDPDSLVRRIAPVFDATEVSALRLDLRQTDGTPHRIADAVREAAHARDIPVVVCDDLALAEKTGLDGVHLTGVQGVADARDALGSDAIVGAFASMSRHDGMSAGEIGADYVSFGPADVANPELLGLVKWWSEMIEVPVVVEGGLDSEQLRDLAPYADFVALGPEIWSTDEPVAALTELLAAMHG